MDENFEALKVGDFVSGDSVDAVVWFDQKFHVGSEEVPVERVRTWLDSGHLVFASDDMSAWWDEQIGGRSTIAPSNRPIRQAR